jgi:WXXGXW repeat (2 copies)
LSTETTFYHSYYKGDRTMKKVFLTAACGLFFTAGIANSQVVVRIGPPPPHAVERIPPPPPAHPYWAWHAGYYRWHGGRYVWVPGYYVQPPRAHAVWVAGHWVPRNGGYVWVEGHWR